MKRALPVALVALVVLTSGHRFFNDFVYDDDVVIVEGEVIHDPGNLAAVWTHHTMFASASDPGAPQSVDTYRPVPITLFMWDAWLSGREPWSYHLTNLLLHVGCVLLVFAVGRRLLVARDQATSESHDDLGAFYGAAVFAVHPWLVEAHVWINGRSDPLALLFGLAAMLALGDASRAPSVARQLLTMLAVLLGLLSKEPLVMVLPAIALMPSEGRFPRARVVRARAVPLVAAAAVYGALRVSVLGAARTHRDGAMLAEAAQNLPWLLFDGMRALVAPSMPYFRSLRDEYATLATWSIVLGGGIVIVLLVIAILARRRTPITSWALALFVLPPLMPIAILSTVLWPGFGRYLYVPAAGLAWLLAELFGHARARLSTRLVGGLATLHVGLLAWLAFSFTADFRNGEALYGRAIEARPDVAMGYGWLGMERLDRGLADGARDPLARAVALDPSTHRYLLHLGRAHLTMQDRDAARAVVRIGLARFRGHEAAAYHFLALNAMDRRDPDEAIHHLLECLEAWPGRPDCEYALVTLTHDVGDASAHRDALERHLSARDYAIAGAVRALVDR